MIPIERLEVVDSTNEEAKRRFSSGDAPGPLLLLADAQTAGRGTRGRRWISPPGAGLYLSLLDPAPPGAAAPPTTDVVIAAAVACAEALEALQVPVGIKPVNDLVVDGRKLGGILAESIVRGGRVEALITGVGINLLAAPRDVEPPPIALDALMPPERLARLDRLAFAAELGARLLDATRRAAAGEMERLREGYVRRLVSSPAEGGGSSGGATISRAPGRKLT